MNLPGGGSAGQAAGHTAVRQKGRGAQHAGRAILLCCLLSSCHLDALLRYRELVYVCMQPTRVTFIVNGQPQVFEGCRQWGLVPKVDTVPAPPPLPGH